MNDIYKTPLLTSWPDPFSAKSLKEVFSTKKKIFKRKIKAGAKKLSLISRFLSLF